MSAQGHTPGYGEPWTVFGAMRDAVRAGSEKFVAQCPVAPNLPNYPSRIVACVNACQGLPDPERDVAEMRDALIRISNLDDHSAVRVLAVGIAQDVLARIKARAPEGTP